VDDDVVRAAANLPELRELRMSFSQVTDAGIAALAAGVPRLRVLVIDECLKLTDAALMLVADGCRELQLLSVRRCSRGTLRHDAGGAGRVLLQVRALVNAGQRWCR
jgi:hypothetical protein